MKALLEIVRFDVADVVTASNEQPDCPTNTGTTCLVPGVTQ